MAAAVFQENFIYKNKWHRAHIVPASALDHWIRDRGKGERRRLRPLRLWPCLLDVLESPTKARSRQVAQGRPGVSDSFYLRLLRHLQLLLA